MLTPTEEKPAQDTSWWPTIFSAGILPLLGCGYSMFYDWVYLTEIGVPFSRIDYGVGDMIKTIANWGAVFVVFAFSVLVYSIPVRAGTQEYEFKILRNEKWAKIVRHFTKWGLALLFLGCITMCSLSAFGFADLEKWTLPLFLTGSLVWMTGVKDELFGGRFKIRIPETQARLIFISTVIVLMVGMAAYTRAKNDFTRSFKDTVTIESRELKECLILRSYEKVLIVAIGSSKNYRLMFLPKDKVVSWEIDSVDKGVVKTILPILSMKFPEHDGAGLNNSPAHNAGTAVSPHYPDGVSRAETPSTTPIPRPARQVMEIITNLFCIGLGAVIAHFLTKDRDAKTRKHNLDREADLRRRHFREKVQAFRYMLERTPHDRPDVVWKAYADNAAEFIAASALVDGDFLPREEFTRLVKRAGEWRFEDAEKQIDAKSGRNNLRDVLHNSVLDVYEFTLPKSSQ